MILRHGCCRLVTILAVLMLLAPHCLAQRSLSVFDIDTTRFPTVSASLYALDDDGKRIDALGESDFTVIEDGVLRTVSSVTCQTPNAPVPISSVLAIDVSKSMQDGPPSIDIAKQAATVWVNTMPLATSECAITSFDNVSYLNQDFTNNRTLLLDAINGLVTQGASDFDAALLRAPGGAIPIAARGRFRRVVVLITDGIAAGTESRIVQTALASNVTIFCITLTEKSPDILRTIAEKTGGAWFDNVTSMEDALAIYRRILQQAQMLPPCTIVWQSVPGCTLTRQAEVSYRNGLMADSVTYRAPESSIPLAFPSAEGIEFGPVIPGGSKTASVAITARGGDLTITDLAIDNPLFSMVPKPALPITLKRDASIQITLSFRPVDSAYTYGQLLISSTGCLPTIVHLTGGFPGHPGPRTLTILKPNGGETYKTGMDSLITWQGVQPTDAVRLEYSTDAGGSWKEIAPAATGLKYLWRVPNQPSSRCLVRGTHVIPSMSDTTVIFRGAHTAPVYAATISPDGTQIATASDDKTVRIWSVATAQPISVLTGHTDWVRSVCYSPTGRKLATGSYDGTVIIWDLNTGAILQTLRGHTGWILAVAFSPDGRYVATASRDNTARIWRMVDGQVVHTYTGHTEAVTDVRFNADGTKVVTASGDKTAKIWNVDDGKLFRTFRGHTDWIWAASFTPDGTQLVTGSDDRTAAVWDISTGTIIRRLTAHTGPVRGLSVSPDGNMMATASDDQSIIIWDMASGTSNRVLRGHQNVVRDVAFSASGRMLLSASPDSTTRLWFMDHLLPNRDTSDATFSIIAPALKGPDTLDFGRVSIVASKDSTLSLRNVGGFPLAIESAQLVPVGEFSHVAGFPPLGVPADSSARFRFRFSPVSIGVKYASVEVTTLRGTLRYVLRGEGIDARIQTISSVTVPSISCSPYRDTVVIVRNDGGTPLTVSEVRMQGADAGSFQINPESGGARPMVILPGAEDTIRIRFQPRKPGTSKATLVLRSDAMNLTDSVTSIQLDGTRDSIGFTASPLLLNFGTVAPGASLTQTIRVTNTGTLPLTWTAPVTIGAYTIESIVPATIPPTGTAVMTVRFTPSTDAMSFQEMYTLREPVCGASALLSFTGSTEALASARLEAPDVTGEPNSTIEIPIYLREPRKLAEAGATTVSFGVSLDPFILIPIAPTPEGIVVGDARQIQINAPIPTDGSPVLAVLRFRVAAASKLGTPLSLGQVFTNGKNTTFSTVSGSFTITGVCASGGTRLVTGGDFGLKMISPNPVRSMTAIEFDLIESGQTRLWLTDASGREVAVLVDGPLQNGGYSAEFAPSGLPSGVYLCHLRTPTQYDVRNVIIVK